MVGIAFTCTKLEGDGSLIISHDEFSEHKCENARWPTDLTDRTGKSFGVRESLTILADSCENEAYAG